MFQITRVIWQGRFAIPHRLPELRAAGITHILNVSEAPHVLSAADGPFDEVCSLAIDDLSPIPEPVTLACLDTLHRMATTADSRIYIHCIAGCNRSPTILWLYLIACGIDPQIAKEQISARNIDAVPGHSRLITPPLVARAKELSCRYLPHPRPEVVEFA